MADDNWTLVQDAILAFNMKVPDLVECRAALLKVLEAEAWKHYEPPIGKACEPQSFAEWVTGGIPRGLNTTVKNIMGYAAGADSTFVAALEKAMQQEPGNPTGRNQHSPKVGIDNNVHNSSERESPTGNSESAALRRLRKDRPDLHAQVLANELSAHAAAVQAGFRPRTFTVRADDPEKIAATLRRQLSKDVLKRVVNHLEGW